MARSPAPEPIGRAAGTARTTLQQRVAAAILDAAATVFATEGSDASMASIATAAGVARATVYRYFPTRAVLLSELADVAVDEAGTRLASARLETVDARIAIERAIRALVETGPGIIVTSRDPRGGVSPGYEAQVAEPLRRLFERGQANGEIRTDLTARFLADALVGLLAGVMSASTQLGRDDLVASTAGMFIDGVRGKLRSTSATG